MPQFMNRQQRFAHPMVQRFFTAPLTAALTRLILVSLLTLGVIGRAPARADSGLPPVPQRAIVVLADISASVPLSLAASTRGLVQRSLAAAYSDGVLAQGIPATLVEWIKIGVDSYSPNDVVLRAWIPGVHAQPTNVFLAQRARKQLAGIIAGERRAQRAALASLLRRLAALRFQTEFGTDLEGGPLRASVDWQAIAGHHELLIASDLLGAAPQSDGVPWHMPDTSVDVFEYCSQSAVDNATSCQHRQKIWTEALTRAGASVAWYSSDNLETVPALAL